MSVVQCVWPVNLGAGLLKEREQNKCWFINISSVSIN